MSDVNAADLTQQTVETAGRWRRAVRDAPAEASATRLARVARDAEGLEFTAAFVDGVVLVDDHAVAARRLDQLSRAMPDSLPWHLRAAVSTGGGFGPLAPRAVMPVARRAFRRLVEHLVVDESPDKLGSHLSALASDGSRPNLAPLGEPVIGPAGADRRLARLHDLVARDDVHHVSVSLRDVGGPFGPWALDETASALVARLTPVYELALAGRVPTLIDLDMGRRGELDLTVDVFTRLLDQPSLRRLEAGIALQAYLPDALATLELLTDWARQRVADGGAPIRIRLVKGANLAAEAVDASRHARPAPTLPTKAATDASYRRLLDHALRPENAAVAHVGVATHSLLDLAHAWTLAQRRDVVPHVVFEAVHGLAPAQTRAVAAEVGGMAMYTPVAPPEEFDAAIGGLVRGLIGGPVGVDPADGPGFEREVAAYRRSVAAAAAPAVAVGVEAAAGAEGAPGGDTAAGGPADPTSGVESGTGFVNTPDADPALDLARAWGRRILVAAQTSELGLAQIDGARVPDHSRLEETVARTVQAGVAWGRRDHAERAALLDAVAARLDSHRARLIEVLISETGATLSEAALDVGAAVDAAWWHAVLARGLGDVRGARYAPPRLTVVVPTADSAVSTLVGSVSAALAAGSGVVVRPAPEACRTASVVADLLRSAGVPAELVATAIVDDLGLAHDLLVHPAVDRVVLHGPFETAAGVRSFRGDRELWAETPGLNSVVVAETADLDRAAVDVVAGAFAHAGQAPWAARLVVVVGSRSRAAGFRRRLVDAVAALRIGRPDAATTDVGPLIAPAEGPLLAALTELDPGESWLVAPERLDDDGVLWRPGIRDGVRPGGAFTRPMPGGPVLGLVHVETFAEAVDLQSALERSSTAGLHSLDVDEVEQWLEALDVGSLVVNRAVAAPRAGRSPSGGRRRASVGRTTAAGGAHTVIAQGAWSRAARSLEKSLQLDGVSEPVVRLIEAARANLSFDEFDRIRAAARSDERAWRDVFGASRALGGLEVERTVLRHRPASVVLRLASGGDPVDLVRLIAAATRAGARIDLSTALPLPAALHLLITSPQSPVEVGAVIVESDEAFFDRAAVGSLQQIDDVDDPAIELGMTPSAAQRRRVADYRGLRIRLVGRGRTELSSAVGHSADVAIWTGEVTDEGRVELLPFVHEQTVTVAAHRDGRPEAALRDLRL
ncbi:proline dehydrogenase family protein [Frigoribacterium sp. CFBP9030]|uniref:proline dehydrogenase family protein n=1 Tax=Frigoribacterium sp. CFBP9030 TaxID=3096537 RepID=UPI002A6A896D|nr:proline dehydrogenase family protein [Frigoribacterium sp. CFBP9030]MDY0891531.1 proline dehydrogenase family protein [Frigoribacterium sp. CFBP9030]